MEGGSLRHDRQLQIGNPPNSNQADHKLNQVIFDLPEGCCLIVPSDRGCPSVGRSESNV